ncbi:MAG: hypothetical protein KA714_26230 [Limnoraphis sp. WC205]|jgi:hypothetical protein|nr:hypothetical protein [Limnoraphis sp. WC205]
MMNKNQIWAVVISIAAISSGIFPSPAKADGFPGGKIPRQPPSHQPSCGEVVEDCKSPKPRSLYDEIYSKHKPYCGYLRKHRLRSRHWSEEHQPVAALEDSSSDQTAYEWESETQEDLMASTGDYSGLSTSQPTSSRNQYYQSSAMGGENALVLFIAIGLWFGLPSLFSPKDSKK